MIVLLMPSMTLEIRVSLFSPNMLRFSGVSDFQKLQTTEQLVLKS